MRVLPRRVELSFNVTIQCPHHAYSGEHRRAVALSNQQQRFHRGLPFCGIVFCLGELHYVICGVAEGDELLALGQFDRIEKWLVPRQDSPNSCANGWTDHRVLPGQVSAIQPPLAGRHVAPLLPVKTINQLDFADLS
jgi:hypothetical protein